MKRTDVNFFEPLIGYMLCEACHQQPATVHLTKTAFVDDPGQKAGTQQQQHFCKDCSDAYFSCTPGMNSARGLICLSDSYRSRLYDLLEKVHPEAFDNTDTEACERSSNLTRDFLRKHLEKEKIEVNDDAFEMLWIDFSCSHHFYARIDEYKKRKTAT